MLLEAIQCVDGVVKALKIALLSAPTLIAVGVLVLWWAGPAVSAAVPEFRDFSHHAPTPSQDWGQPVTGITTTYAVYKQDFTYGDAPFLTTDMRPEDKYLDKESYDVHALTVYRAHDGQAWLERQPVVFFVHGGAWIDGYREWYEFVAHSFTGEMGWVTVVIDYRLTSDQVFVADQYCPDRDTCGQPENEPYRTKAAWYPDNIEDVAAAFRWVVEHIEENGGDVSRIVVFGHSAGTWLRCWLRIPTTRRA